MGATKSVAVTAAAEVPAKSMVARLPRKLSNNIPLVPPRPSVRRPAPSSSSVLRG
jgi:hypothetical protein